MPNKRKVSSGKTNERAFDLNDEKRKDETKEERMKEKKSETCKTERIYSPVLLCLPCPFMSCFVYRAPEFSHTALLLFFF